MTQCCGSFGGTFNPLEIGSTPTPSSTGSGGRHGSQNLWSRWKQVGSTSKGIAARAPSDQGDIEIPPNIGGGTKHNTGMGLGAHGHGIGVIKAAIGGPHNPQTTASTIMNIGGNRTLVNANPLCKKCLTTWLAVFGIVLLIMIFTGK
jgi:hypothetical protein